MAVDLGDARRMLHRRAEPLRRLPRPVEDQQDAAEIVLGLGIVRLGTDGGRKALEGEFLVPLLEGDEAGDVERRRLLRALGQHLGKDRFRLGEAPGLEGG